MELPYMTGPVMMVLGVLLLLLVVAEVSSRRMKARRKREGWTPRPDYQRLIYEELVAAREARRRARELNEEIRNRMGQ